MHDREFYCKVFMFGIANATCIYKEIGTRFEQSRYCTSLQLAEHQIIPAVK